MQETAPGEIAPYRASQNSSWATRDARW